MRSFFYDVKLGVALVALGFGAATVAFYWDWMNW